MYRAFIRFTQGFIFGTSHIEDSFGNCHHVEGDRSSGNFFGETFKFVNFGRARKFFLAQRGVNSEIGIVFMFDIFVEMADVQVTVDTIWLGIFFSVNIGQVGIAPVDR